MERANPHVTPSTISVLAAWATIAASGTAVALLLSLHVLSPEFSPAWRMISEYANGQYGWVLALMFSAYGASSLTLAVAVGCHLKTRRGLFHPGLALLVLSGIAQASAAQFDLNQVALHELAGVVGILCLPVAAMLISPILAATAASESAKKLILLVANRRVDSGAGVTFAADREGYCSPATKRGVSFWKGRRLRHRLLHSAFG